MEGRNVIEVNAHVLLPEASNFLRKPNLELPARVRFTCIPGELLPVRSDAAL